MQITGQKQAIEFAPLPFMSAVFAEPFISRTKKKPINSPIETPEKQQQMWEKDLTHINPSVCEHDAGALFKGL